MRRSKVLFLIAATCCPVWLRAATYETGPGRTYTEIGAAPWTSLNPGDTVNIYPRTPVILATAAASSGATLTFAASSAAVAVGSSVYIAGGPATLPSVIGVDGNTVTLDQPVAVSAAATVKFYPPYFEKLILTRKGTEAAPLVIRGVPDPESGALPILDATGAKTSPNMQHYSDLTMDDLGLVVTAPVAGTRDDYPKWVTISRLRVQHARGGVSYTDINGAKRTLAVGSAGVRLWQADHVTLEGLEVYENDNGIFAKTNGTAVWSQFSPNLTVRRDHFWSNGLGTQCHQSYIEVNGVVYEFNFYDLPKAGTSINQLKDRSAGMIIRYNFLLQAGRFLDLVETQDGQGVLLPLPSYRESFVYGNIFYMTAPPPTGATFIHYGFDGVVSADRAGTLYVYHNTFVSERDYNEAYRIVMLTITGPADRVDFRNNIVVNKPLNSGKGNPLLGWTYSAGAVDFSVNWVSPNWAACRDGIPCSANISGTGNFYTPSSIWDTPGFADLLGRDFRLLAGSTAIGRAGSLAPAVTANSLGMDLTPRYQYVAPMLYSARPGVQDLGAYESGMADAPLRVTTPSMAIASINTPYTQTLAAAGGTPPYTWTLATGALCNGLSLSSDGVISGVPPAAGACSFSVAARDANGATAVMPLSIRVSPQPGITGRGVTKRRVIPR